MIAIIIKDLVQHRTGLLIYSLSVVLGPIVFLNVTRNPGPEGFIGILIGFLGFGAPMLLAMWVIGQEKVKGTFRMLRLLPIKPEEIIYSKIATTTTVCLFLLNTTLFLDPLLMKVVFGKAVGLSGIIDLDLNLAMLVTCAICCCLFTLFEQKVATQACYWTLFALAGSVFLAQKTAVGQRVGSLKLSSLWLSLSILTVSVLAWVILSVVAARVFSWRDWGDLEED